MYVMEYKYPHDLQIEKTMLNAPSSKFQKGQEKLSSS
jgi:hypothetical protein